MDIARRDRLAGRRFKPSIYFEYSAVWQKHHEADFDRNEVIGLLRRQAQEMLDEAEKLVDTGV
jgi:hypothetical protein